MVYRSGAGHLWPGAAPALTSALGLKIPLVPARRIERLWECKVTPAGCVCQERNTTGCISSNDGRGAGAGRWFSTGEIHLRFTKASEIKKPEARERKRGSLHYAIPSFQEGIATLGMTMSMGGMTRSCFGARRLRVGLLQSEPKPGRRWRRLRSGWGDLRARGTGRAGRASRRFAVAWVG